MPESNSHHLSLKRSRWARLRDHMDEEIDETSTDLILLVCCFITGLVDSAVFNVWSCFVSMQTGNTIYLGLGASGQPLSQPYRWAKSGTAILSFVVGNYFFSRLMRHMKPLRRLSVTTAFFLQAILTLVSAAMIETGIAPGRSEGGLSVDWIILLPIGLLSFQSAGQIAMSRNLEFNDTTTVVLTSTYADLVIDPNAFAATLSQNPKRNRRVAQIVLMLTGAIAGGFITKHNSLSYALWPAGAIKIGITAAWLYWKSKGRISLD